MSKKGKGAKIVKWIVCVVLLLFGVLLMLPLVIRSLYIPELPIHLVTGWATHAWKALPPLFGKWQAAVLPFGCLLMVAGIAHCFVRRWVKVKFPDRIWRIRHTGAVLSLLLLGSAAVIAASGVVHQFLWMNEGKMTIRKRSSDIIWTMQKGRDLNLALFEYHFEKSRFPNSLEELEGKDGEYPGLTEKLWWLDLRNGRPPEPWILLRPGSAETELEPLIVSPVIPGYKMVVVGYGDSSMKQVKVEDLAELLRQNTGKTATSDR